MNINAFFDDLNYINSQLIGDIELNNDEIKWSYDALGDDYDVIDGHLNSIYETDYEIIKEFLEEKNLTEDLTILPPEFDDIYVSFTIVEE